MKMKNTVVLLCALAGVLGMSSPAHAGNIVLTGHDDDFHFVNGASPGAAGPAGLQLAAMLSFARAGSGLPVLVFDQGTELTTALTGLGISFTNVNPALGVPAASLFSVLSFSAMIVASDSSCGGC